jgi:NTE family protein
MGADVLIVVDVTFPLLKRAALDSPLSISNQMIAILVRKNADRQRASLGPGDVMIEPVLGTMASTDFAAAAHAIEIGEAAARSQSAQLAGLSVSEADYRQYTARRAARETQVPAVSFVRVDPDSKRYEKTIMAAMRPAMSNPLDLNKVDAAITELYGLGNFETLDYGLVNQGEGDDRQNGLEVRARRKSWGPNYVRFGLNLQDDFQGNSRYNAAARFLITEIDDLGAELLSDVQLGNNPKVDGEFYQPLTAQRRWFVAPSFRIEARDLTIYTRDVEVADFRERDAEADLDIGRNLGDWGEIRAGLHRINGATRVRFGDPDLVDKQFNNGELFFKFSYDRLDNVDFPRDGQTFSVQWDADRLGLGSDIASDRVQADWLMARSRGRNTLLLWTSAGTTLDGNIKATSLQDFYSLGGFFNLSGLAPQSLIGPDYVIARAIYFRKIGRGGEGLFDFPAYIGMSFEAGNTWNRRGDINWGSAHKDASLFLGFDTLLGPLYLGTGYDESGNSAFYLFLGRTF